VIDMQYDFGGVLAAILAGEVVPLQDAPAEPVTAITFACHDTTLAEVSPVVKTDSTLRDTGRHEAAGEPVAVDEEV
jgi:hypothetical protein